MRTRYFEKKTSDNNYVCLLTAKYEPTISISSSSTLLSSLFSFTAKAWERDWTGTPLGYVGFIAGRVRLPIKFTTNTGNTYTGTWYYRDEHNAATYPFVSWFFDTGITATNGAVEYSLWTDGGPAIPTSLIFNTSNKTTKNATLTVAVSTTGYFAVSSHTRREDPPTAGDGQCVATILTTDKWGSDSTTIGTISVTLNAPPTFTASQVSYDTNYVYAGYTTASVTISDLTAYYGGDITTATLTIGNQTVSRSTNGTLSIPLSTAGTFTPVVSVIDSRGQTTTKYLNPITVLARQNPSCTITADRVAVSSGKYVKTDEGTNAVITMSNITWTSAVATLDAPTVTVTDRNQQTTSPTVTWYANWAADGTLSNQITNWTTYTGTTAYGLITNSFDVRYGYTIKVTPRDKDVNNVNHSGAVAAFQLPSAYYTIDFLAGGHGITFGAFATREGFYSEMDTMFGGEVYLDLDTNTTGTTDQKLYTALTTLGWWSDVNVNV